MGTTTKGRTLKDEFSQIAYLYCVESAANTLTFAKLDIATGALLGQQKYGMLIHRICMEPVNGMIDLLVGAADTFDAAITVSSNITAITLENPEVIDRFRFSKATWGAPASGELLNFPIVHDFSGLGGLLVPADKLYLAVKGLSLASAVSMQCRIFYTMMELDVASYWDLIESRRIIST